MKMVLFGSLVAVAAASTGAIVYYSVPQAKYTGRIIYLVGSSSEPVLNNVWDSRRNPAMFRSFQIATIKSRMVLNAAVLEQGVAGISLFEKDKSMDAVEYLQKNLKVELTGEHMHVALEGDDPQDLLTILKAINMAYLKQVNEKERLRRRERYQHLTALLSKQNEIIRKVDNNIKNIMGAAVGHDALLYDLEVRHLKGEMNNIEIDMTKLTRLESDLQLAIKELESKTKLPAALREVDPAVIEKMIKTDPRVLELERTINDLDTRIKSANELLSSKERKPPQLNDWVQQRDKHQSELKDLRQKMTAEYKTSLQKDLLAGEKQLLETAKERLGSLREREKQTKINLDQVVRRLNELELVVKSTDELTREKKNAETIAEDINKQLVAIETEMEQQNRVQLWEDAYVTPGVEDDRRLRYALYAAGTVLVLGALLFLFILLVRWMKFQQRRSLALDAVLSKLAEDNGTL